MDYERAIEYLRKAIDIWEEFGKDDNLDIALAYDNLDGVLYNQNDMQHTKESVTYIQKAFDIRQKLLPSNSADWGFAYGNYASVCEDSDKRLEYLNKSLNAFLSTVGENHTDTAGAYRSIGNLYYDNDDYEKCIIYQKKGS
jgi:tetratricopeptide (TPR) repeat protein